MSKINYSKHIVLIKDGELLPIQKNSPCLRMGSLAKTLVKHGYQVTWLATTWSHQFKHKIDSEGSYEVSQHYRVILLECGSYTKNISISRINHHKRFGLKVSKWLEKQVLKPSLVLSAYPIPSVAASAAQFCHQNEIPFILDIRDLWPDVFLDKLGKIGRFFAYPLIRKQTKDLQLSLGVVTDVIAVSKKYLEWGRQSTIKQDRSKVYYHHFPIGAEKIDRKNEALNTLDKSDFEKLKGKYIFSFLGSFGKSYDLNLIIKAAQHYNEQGNKSIHFCIAGDGEQRPLIEKYANLLPNLTYLGWLNAAQTRIFLSSSDVGIMPLQSVSGTFPNKPFQYMAASLPIISSLEGEFAEFLIRYDIGLNFQQNNLSSFLQAIENLQHQSRLKEMQNRVSQYFDKNFEQEVIYSNYARVVINKISCK